LKTAKIKNGDNTFAAYRLWGPGDQGVCKATIFTAKGTRSLRKSTSFGPFCVNIGWGGGSNC